MKAIGYACSARSFSGRNGSDSLSLQICEAEGERAAFALIARAGGEREHADVAGATAVRMYREWFGARLRGFFGTGFDSDQIHSEFMRIKRELSKRVYDYGIKNRIMLKIDVSAALFAEGAYCIYCGDETCAIKLTPQACEMISVQYCDETPPDYCSGQAAKGDVYLLYTKEIGDIYSPETLRKCFMPEKAGNILTVRMRLSHLTETCTRRYGLGNSSAILVHFPED